MSTKTFTSTKNINAEKIFALLEVGMDIEYSDPANDCDYGNYGTITGLHKEFATQAFTGFPYYRYYVSLSYPNGFRDTITAGQVLGYRAKA